MKRVIEYEELLKKTHELYGVLAGIDKHDVFLIEVFKHVSKILDLFYEEDEDEKSI